MNQLATLTFNQDLRKSVGGRHQTRDFAPAGRQWRGGRKFRIGDGVDRIGGLSQRACDSARNRQNRHRHQADGGEPDDDAGIDGIGLAKKRQ